MKIEEIYELCIEAGKCRDPRGAGNFEYPDSSIVYGDKAKTVKTILVGIDITPAEVTLASHLRARGVGIDMILSHHPHGSGSGRYAEAMGMQVDLLRMIGFSDKSARAAVRKSVGKVTRSLYSRNIESTVQLCKILDIPLVCIHTPADNMAWDYISSVVGGCTYLNEIIEVLRQIPEYEYFTGLGMPPVIIRGSSGSKRGKFWVDMTGVHPLPDVALRDICEHKIKTIVAMHLFEETYKIIRKLPLNYILAGHLPSDSLGFNLMLDELQGGSVGFKIIPCGGFIRIDRSKT